MASTLGSPTYFCASVCAGAGPCSTGVSPPTSFTLRPRPGASDLTAYFAQLSCSAPRQPARPVIGVTNGSVIVLLQLKFAADARTAALLPCALAAITDMARTANARTIAFFIYVSSLPGGNGAFGGLALKQRSCSVGGS